jgi:hypothetical protein
MVIASTFVRRMKRKLNRLEAESSGWCSLALRYQNKILPAEHSRRSSQAAIEMDVTERQRPEENLSSAWSHHLGSVDR